MCETALRPRETRAEAEAGVGERTPRRSDELYGIQMLRGIAAAMVVVHHVLEVAGERGIASLPNWLVTAGASGVDIFFVISGCIMVHTSFRPGRPPLRPASFLARRVTRIFPIYWLCCAGLVGLASLRYHGDIDLRQSVLALLLLPGDTPIIPYSWTLNYEFYFYILFAMGLWTRSVASTIAITIAGLLGLGIAFGAGGDGAWRAFFTDPVPLEFVMGMGLAVIARRHAALLPRGVLIPVIVIPAVAMLVAGPAFIAHAGTVGLPGWPRVLAWGVPAALIVAAGLAIGAPRNAVQRLAIVFGNASYSLYLTHIFVMLGYRFVLRFQGVRDIPAPMTMALCFLAACAVGIACHLLVEVPLMAFSRRLGSHELLVWRRARSA